MAHHRDRGVGGDALRRVHVERVGEADPLHHRIARLQLVEGAVARLHLDPRRVGRDDAGDIVVVEAAVLVVLGPADLVALMQLDLLALGELHRVGLVDRRYLLRIEGPYPVADLDLNAPLRVDAEHVIGAGAEAELAHGMAQVDHLAGLIGMRVAEFLARDVDLVEDRGDDAVPFQRALRGEAVLDAHVELCARDAARREHRGGLALFGG